MSNDKTPLEISPQPEQDSTKSALGKSNAAQPGKKPAKKRRSWWVRLLKWIGLLILLILIALAGVLYFVLGTEKGLQVTTAKLNQYLPEYVSIGESKGRLADRFEIHNLEIYLPTQEIPLTIDYLHLDWKLTDLFKRRLKIHELVVDSADLPILPSAEETPKKESAESDFYPFSFSKIAYPFIVEIDRIRGNDIYLAIGEELTVASPYLIANDLHYNEKAIDIGGLGLRSDIFVGDSIFPLEINANGDVNMQTDEIQLNLSAIAMNSKVEGNDFNFAMVSDLHGPINQLGFRMNSRVDWLEIIHDPVLQDVTLKIINQEALSGNVKIKNLSNHIDLKAAWSLQHPLELYAELLLDAPNLNEINPRIEGSAHGDFEVKGYLLRPLVKSDLTINKFAGFGASLEHLKLNATHDEEKMLTAFIDLDTIKVAAEEGDPLVVKSVKLDALGDIEHQLDSVLTVSDISKGRKLIDEIKLTFDGALTNHKINLTTQSEFGTLDFGGIARLLKENEARKWTFYIDKTEIRSNYAGNYSLKKPTYLYADRNELYLSSYCLTELPFSFCMEGSHRPENSVGVLTIRNMSSAFLKQYLPENIEVNTRLNAVITGQYKTAEDFKGIADIFLDKGTVGIMLEGRKVDIPLKLSNIHVSANPDLVDGAINFDWGSYLKIDGGAKIKSVMKENNSLQGQVVAHIPNFEWLGPIVPYLQDLKGKVYTEGRLYGSLKDPKLYAWVGISDGALYLPKFNTKVHRVNVVGVLKDDKPEIELQGSLYAGDGKLSLKGNLDYQKLYATAEASGKNLELANTGNIKAYVSPDVRFRMENERYYVTGNVEIPKFIYAHESSESSGRGSVISASPDVVIISKNGAKRGSSFMDALKMDVKVDLGDEIAVGMGRFLGYLSGDIRILKEFFNPISAEGMVTVGSGEYSIYGQRLTLDKGHVQFSGGIITNPGIDFQASREMEVDRTGRKTRVGVRVTGTAKRPRLTLFSSPTMQDLAIVSYLFLGREPNFESPTENLMLLNMLRKIASGEDPAAETMAEKVGLTDLGLTQDYMGNMAFGLGKQFTDKLYLGLGMGIEEEGAYGTARYRFGKYFSLDGQFTTDNGTSVNLIYSRDF